MTDEEEKSVVVARCPSCGARDIRKSRTGGFRDRLMQLFGRVPWRCRGCSRRFYRPAGVDEAA